MRAPAPITSTRPGCMTGMAARPARVMASSRPAISWTCPAGIRAWWMRAGSYSSRPRAIAATVVTDPASPTSVAAFSPDTAAAASGPGRVGLVGAGAVVLGGGLGRRGGGGVVVQVPLGQPDAADVPRAGARHPVGSPQDELGGAAADVGDEVGRRA